MAWVFACLHAAWFFAAIASMGPASGVAAQFRDTLEGADFTVFTGRFFHFYYEPKIVKSLIFADLPAGLAASLAELLVSPLTRLAHLGTYEASYIAAAELLLAGSFQWLVIGRVLALRWRRSKIAKTPV